MDKKIQEYDEIIHYYGAIGEMVIVRMLLEQK